MMGIKQKEHAQEQQSKEIENTGISTSEERSEPAASPDPLENRIKQTYLRVPPAKDNP